MDEKKQRELLPDILNHQSNMGGKLEQLDMLLGSFEEAWKLKMEELKEGKIQPKDAERLSTIDEIYRGMERAEEHLERAIMRLQSIQSNFLGDI